MEMRECPLCGAEVLAGSEFCMSCGAALDEPQMAKTPDEEAVKEAVPEAAVQESRPSPEMVQESRPSPEMVQESRPSSEMVQEGFWSRNKKKLLVICGILAVIVIVFVSINESKKAALKKELLRGWEDVEGEDGAYIVQVLDFTEDEIVYRLETGYVWMNRELGSYEYKVISGNKIKVKRYGDKYKTYTVEFNEDKSMMILSPALTELGDKEYFFNLGY